MIGKFLLAFFILHFSIYCLGQSDISQTTNALIKDSVIVKEDIVPEDVFLITTSKPFFPGGRSAMIDFISENLHYPKSAIDNNIEGKIILKFIIDSEGKICCIDIIGEAIGYGLEEEAIRIVKGMPRWYPAYMDDRPVAVYYRLPISFKYYEEEHIITRPIKEE